MSCFGSREKTKVKDYHKWDYITLSDFRSSNCFTTLSYMWLWILAIIAVAVYAADTFTAVNLLAYDKWSSQVQPAIPLNISKWIFTGCILFSWALCIFEWIRAVQIMKRRSVSDDYLDPLASTLQCLRGGEGYRKFLVFAALTKSKKGNDYVALFAYFQFKSMIRIIVAQGPRQVINAITLWSVMRAQILHDNDATGLEKFWKNIEALASQQQQQAVILFSMLFTLIIWVFSALSLIAAFVLYVTFLWHFIPREDGTVSAYCRRKIEKRLENAVRKNYQKALDKEEAKRVKAEVEAMKYGRRPPPPDRKPTLPVMDDNDSDIFTNPGLSRSTTQTTLPSYSAKPDLARMNTVASERAASGLAEPKLPHLEPRLPQLEPKLPDIAEKEVVHTPPETQEPTLPIMEPSLPNLDGMGRPQMPARAFTANSNASKTSIASDAPLLARAATMGSAESRLLESASDAPMPSRPPISHSFSTRQAPRGPLRTESSGTWQAGTPGRDADLDNNAQSNNWNDPPMVNKVFRNGSSSSRGVPTSPQAPSTPAWPLTNAESFEMQPQRHLQEQIPNMSEPLPSPPPQQRQNSGPGGPPPRMMQPEQGYANAGQNYRMPPPGGIPPYANNPPPMRYPRGPPPPRNDYFEHAAPPNRYGPPPPGPRGRFPVRPDATGGWRPGPGPGPRPGSGPGSRPGFGPGPGAPQRYGPGPGAPQSYGPGPGAPQGYGPGRPAARYPPPGDYQRQEEYY